MNRSSTFITPNSKKNVNGTPVLDSNNALKSELYLSLDQ